MDKIIIFGEKINTINQAVAKALEEKDKKFFQQLTQAQLKSGIVDVIDINVGSNIQIEAENMRWAVETIEEVTNGEIPLSIDSSDPGTIIAGIEGIKNKKGTYLNSITLEKKRYRDLLPLAKEHNLNIIALPIDENGIPRSSSNRLKLAYRIVDLLLNYGISLDKLFIDCLIEPVSISKKNAMLSLETVSKIKHNIPQVRTFICLSAVSFGLPNRRLINRNFLSLLIKEGIDSIILDPLDDNLVDNLYAAKMLLEKDENCMNYINYIRRK